MSYRKGKQGQQSSQNVKLSDAPTSMSQRDLPSVEVQKGINMLPWWATKQELEEGFERRKTQGSTQGFHLFIAELNSF